MPLIADIMRDYLAEAQQQLTSSVGRIVIAPGGSVAWDNCCDGQLYIRLVSVQARGRTNCAPLWVHSIQMGVVRCAATINDAGQPPSATQVTDDALEAYQDLRQLKQAILNVEHTETIGSWNPLGVTGGCHGGEWSFTVVTVE